MTTFKQSWDWKVECFYGKYAETPKKQGDLAISTFHKGAASKDMEVAAGRMRLDIGLIKVTDMTKENSPAIVVYEE